MGGFELICIDWVSISVLWYLLDGLIFAAAIGAYAIAKTEERYWKQKNRGAK